MLLLFLTLQISSFADGNSTQITNSTNILDQYLDYADNNSTSQVILPMGNATLSPDSQIEIGKSVKWMQVVSLNDTVDNIAIEIPEDAEILEITIEDDSQKVEVIDENQILTVESITLLDENETEIVIENSVNSTVIIDNQESLLVQLESVESSDDENTKLIVVSDEHNVEQIQIEYETAAPYTIETESDEDTYEKTVTVKSDSAIHYENVRSYSSIPEEYVLQGIPFTLDWIINGTTVNVIDDPRFDVTFEDTNDNGLIDRMSWIVPQLSEKTFSINADTRTASDIDDVPSKLELMQQKFDKPFYDKTLHMMNAKVTGNITNFLTDERGLENGDLDSIEDFEYYDVLIVVPTFENVDGDLVKTVQQNRDNLSLLLEQDHNAKNIYKAEKLSFVTASVPIDEITKLSDYGDVKIIGDGEIPIQYELNTSKGVINAENIPFGVGILDGSGVKVAVIDSGISNDEALPEDTKIIKRIFCNTNICIDNPTIDAHIYDQNSGLGHGTIVAGIISGLSGDNEPFIEPSGVAPGSQIISIMQSVNTEDKEVASVALARSIDRSFVYGSDIINLSIGLDTDKTPCDFATVNHIVDEAIDEGVIIVKSAGNSADNFDGKHNISDPGCAYNVITVGSYNEFTQDYDGSSSKGPTNNDIHRLKPEVLALGVRILSPVKDGGWNGDDPPGDKFVTGTSYAAPHVSGAAALLLQSHPEATPLEIRAALMTGAKWNENKMDLALPLTAITYEEATRAWLNGDSIPVNTNDHHLLNRWGFGLIDVKDSNDLLNGGKIQSGSFDGTSTEPLTYVFNAEEDEVVRILLSWKSRPTISDEYSLSSSNINSESLSNLDLSLAHSTSPNNAIAYSTSTVQNNEFIVFRATQGGQYIITVTPTSIVSNIGVEPFVLSSTKQLLIPGGTANTKPQILMNTDFEIVADSQETFTVGINGHDADGDDVTFFVTQHPEHGTLSAFKHFNDPEFQNFGDPTLNYNAIINYTANSSFDGTDSFQIRPYDGKDLGAQTRIDISSGTRDSDLNIAKNSDFEVDESFTVTVPDGGADSLSLSLHSSDSVAGLKVESNNVVGMVLKYEYDSNFFTEHIPPNENKLLIFPDIKSLSNVSVDKQTSLDGGSVIIGYLNEPITSQYPPSAKITTATTSVDENTTVILDGSQSSDPDSPILSYAWTQPPTANAPQLSFDENAQSISFDIPELGLSDSQYPVFLVFRLTVSDGEHSSTDTLLLRVHKSPTEPPPPTDTTPPTITLNGDNPQTITIPNPYTELGAVATDNTDDDISSSIVIDSSSVDVGTVGTYPVTYDVTDSAGNAAAQVVRTVNVTESTLPSLSTEGIITGHLTITQELFGDSATDLTVPSGQTVSVSDASYRNLTIEDGGALLVSDGIVRINGNYTQVGSGHIKVAQTGCEGGNAGTTIPGVGGPGGYYFGVENTLPDSYRGELGSLSAQTLPTDAASCTSIDTASGIIDHILQPVTMFETNFKNQILGGSGSNGTPSQSSGNGGHGGNSDYNYQNNQVYSTAAGIQGGNGGKAANGVNGVAGGGKLVLFVNNVTSELTIIADGADGIDGNKGTGTTSDRLTCNGAGCSEWSAGGTASSSGTLGSAGSQGGTVFLVYGFIPDNITPHIDVSGGLGGFHGADASSSETLTGTRADSGPSGFYYMTSANNNSSLSESQITGHLTIVSSDATTTPSGSQITGHLTIVSSDATTTPSGSQITGHLTIVSSDATTTPSGSQITGHLTIIQN